MSDAKDTVMIPVPMDVLEKAALEEVRKQVRMHVGNHKATQSYLDLILRQVVQETLSPDYLRGLVKEVVLSFLKQREGWLWRVLRQDKRDLPVSTPLLHPKE